MHAYRTHNCGALTADAAGETVRLSGWVHNKRDHGGVLFVDLRDHYGITQVVADSDSPALPVLEKLKLESVVTIDGTVKARAGAAVNPNLPTGGIEVFAAGRHGPEPRGRAAADRQLGGGLPRGNPAQVPLHRPAARARARQHHAALERHRQPAHAG